MFRPFLVGLTVVAGAAQAQEVTLSLSGELRQGAAVQVDWTGPNGQGDWVGLAPVGSSGSSWSGGSYAYTSAGSPARFTLPSEPGNYELRYVTGASVVLASQTLSVAGIPVTAGEYTLSPFGGLIGGASLTVAYSGPTGSGDRIGLATASMSPTSFVSGSVTHVSSGNPVSIALPLGGGDFELRYVSADTAIRAMIPFSVQPGPLPVVTLTAMEAAPGAAMSVPLPDDAPRRSGDYLYIARPGASPTDYSGGWTSIPSSGAVNIAAPAEAGEWELRYVISLNGSYQPVGSAPLMVTAPVAAPPQAPAASK